VDNHVPMYSVCFNTIGVVLSRWRK